MNCGMTYDYILLDSPAGIEQGFQVAIAGADRCPWWSRHRRFPLFGMRIASLDYCFPLRFNDIKLIVNRIRPDMIRQGQMLNLKDISDILCVDVIGAICDDEQVVISTNNGTSTDRNWRPWQGKLMLRYLSARLLGEDVPLPRFAVSAQTPAKAADTTGNGRRKYITG